ncbi:protease inhibitor I42 family protein [Paenibacillus zanthoxyli]|uniref:protease inhibitor I42 family protein n=1 Tax=Paenibacillus zanthoxyli TaxID=369399 RepID=UPI0038CD5A1C
MRTNRTNLTTGSTWAYQADSKNIKLISDSSKTTSDAIGAPSDKTWTFKASKPGTYKLKFSYAQPWEGKQDKKGSTVSYVFEDNDLLGGPFWSTGKKDRIVPFPRSIKEMLAMHADSMKKKQAVYLFEIFMEEEVH